MRKLASFNGTINEYAELHRWVKKVLGKPDTCEQCNRSGLYGISIHWANLSGEYKREVSDWAKLCAVCHGRFDRPTKTVCKRGHLFKEGNIYVNPKGDRMCKECKRITRRRWRQKQREKAVRD